MGKETSLIDIASLERLLFQETIEDDIVILDDVSKVPFFDHPAKIDKAFATICLEGYAEGSINLRPCRYSANDFFIVLPGQIIQYLNKSDDFRGLFIVVSKRFVDNFELNAKDSVSMFFYLQENPIMHLNSEELVLLLDFFTMLKRALQQTHNPQRIEMVRLLGQAFFYGIYGSQQLQRRDNGNNTKKGALFDAFYHLILRHYKDSREVGFYADKLCLTPKYLSTVIRELTGKSALDWINGYVILEAKSLLKSTDKTVQQISNELNFPSQSFFGKYFKRLVGVSPKEYRNT